MVSRSASNTTKYTKSTKASNNESLDTLVLVVNRLSLLKLERDPIAIELMCRALFAGGLEQPWDQVTMNFDGTAE